MDKPRLAREKTDFYSHKNVTQGGIWDLYTILIGDRGEAEEHFWENK